MSADLSRSTALPDNRPEMVRLGRKLLLAQLAEIQFLRGRRRLTNTHRVPLPVLCIKDRQAAAKRRLAWFRRCYANHRALQAAIARDARSAA